MVNDLAFAHLFSRTVAQSAFSGCDAGRWPSFIEGNRQLSKAGRAKSTFLIILAVKMEA